MPRKPALGRGLKALIPETPRARSGLAEIPLDRIRRNPTQPRTAFDAAALGELARSIKEHGILQPLLVSDNGADGYLLIAGERRLRAAKLAGLAAVPAVIREHLEEGTEFELALVENLQRRDLTPLEEARAFEHLRNHRGLSQADIADRVGIDRSTVANALRLLKLPESVQRLVAEGQLLAGHARTLLSFAAEEDRELWAQRTVDENLSVRDLERAAAENRGAASKRTEPQKPQPRDPNLLAAEEKLSRSLGAEVKIRSGRRGARIVISCTNAEELVRVFDLLLKEGH